MCRTIRSLVFVDDQLAVPHVVAEGRHATHPHALLLGCGDLVAHPLSDHLPFELGEGQQDVERQPPHAGRGVELLRDRDERDIVAIEDLHQLGEVRECSRQAIDLVDNDDVDLSGLDIGHQPLQGRAFHRAAGVTAVIVEGRQRGPAFVLLRQDEGGAGLTLGIERVERLIQPLVCRLPCVDGASALGC